MTETIKVQGVNGQLELTESVLRIKRGGALAFVTQGLKGDKEIQISQVSSVQLKAASFLLNGYIQFAFVGGQEAKGGIFQGVEDENTVMFRKSEQKQFEDFRDELQRRVSSFRAGSTPASTSSLDEIDKLASLRERGIVSEEEFEKKKKMLLGL